MFQLEACTGTGETGTPRALRGHRGDGYGDYGGSAVSDSELNGEIAACRESATS